MNSTKKNAVHRIKIRGLPVVLCSLALGLLLFPGAIRAEEPTAVLLQPQTEALRPGEILTYDVSWSEIVTAGIAVMEIKAGTLPDGDAVLKFIVTTRTVGIVKKFYKVNDRLESVFDPEINQSLTFTLDQSHGKRKKKRELVFDHEKNTVVSRLNNEQPETFTIPDGTQDALSSLYYLRTRSDFIVGKPIVVQVHDSGKTWAVEIQTLGKEQVTTPAGKFDTIKVRTFPKYEGVFMNKGEIFIWLTDDSRKVPVKMESTISIGAIVSTLTKMESGK